jgi:chromosome partitioning protein
LIISVTNQKGGVGKTTTAVNISAALAFMGKSTLLVDTDPQANSTISAVSDPSKYEKSLYDVMVDSGSNIEEIIATSTIPGLDVAISKISMAKLETSLLGSIDSHYRLKDMLSHVKKKYEYIIIDTPPTLGMITLNALVASNFILIPIQSSFLCLEGTDDLLETIEKVKKVFREVISKSVKLEECPAYKESIFTFAPNSVGAMQYKSVVKELLRRAKK